jgi:hypothetical protein
MEKLVNNQKGLIPMLICLFAVVIGLIVLVYIRVQNAQ